MNDREAMQALLDGKKIRLKNATTPDRWFIYMHFDDSIRMHTGQKYFCADWEIYEEPNHQTMIEITNNMIKAIEKLQAENGELLKKLEELKK